MNLVANACALKAVYVVKRHWGELILAGAKTVEISHRDCKKCKVQIIGIGFSDSNFIRAEFKVWNTEVLFREQYRQQHYKVAPPARANHCIPEAHTDAIVARYSQIWAWHLDGALEYPEPVPFTKVKGPVRFVSLENNEAYQEATQVMNEPLRLTRGTNRSSDRGALSEQCPRPARCRTAGVCKPVAPFIRRRKYPREKSCSW